MKIISKANETIMKILDGLQKPAGDNCRWIHYSAQTQVDEGILLFNLLTRELVLLSFEEYADINNLPYLKAHWFLVPEGLKEKELAELAKWVYANQQKKSREITGYTIFTTTDCNARCFYCFELGRSRIPMSEETALKVVDYIEAHCGGKTVKLSWFGGEPLYNAKVIDTICDGLQQKGIAYTSTMVSNGYLFDSEMIEKAADKWNVKWVQITLDGTEQVYNHIKAYIHDGQSPYQVVLNNIKALLDASVAVNIRLNMDMHNADNLLQLVDELRVRFCGEKGLNVYAHHLFKDGVAAAEQYTHEQWQERDAAMCQLEEKIVASGFHIKRGIAKDIRLNHCMADSGKSVTILPDGNIGLCEQYSETEFIGHIDREGFDQAMVTSWRERISEIPECAECFLYPECIKLKKCSSESACYHQFREGQLRMTHLRMKNEYNSWRNKEDIEENEDAIGC